LLLLRTFRASRQKTIVAIFALLMALATQPESYQVEALLGHKNSRKASGEALLHDLRGLDTSTTWYHLARRKAFLGAASRVVSRFSSPCQRDNRVVP
jgi:hypothetical protein